MAAIAPEASASEGPAWLDRSRYPFEHHYVDMGPGRLHYVDEGDEVGGR